MVTPSTPTEPLLRFTAVKASSRFASEHSRSNKSLFEPNRVSFPNPLSFLHGSFFDCLGNLVNYALPSLLRTSGLRTTVSIGLLPSSNCRSLRLSLPVSCLVFYPHRHHCQFISTRISDYYETICRPLDHMDTSLLHLG